MDEPPMLGGEDSAPNPAEYALASLESCQAITYRLSAEHLGIFADQLTTTVEGDLDIRSLSGSMTACGPAFSCPGPGRHHRARDPERYQQLAAAVDEHCPVLDLFRNPVPVARTITAR